MMLSAWLPSPNCSKTSPRNSKRSSHSLPHPPRLLPRRALKISPATAANCVGKSQLHDEAQGRSRAIYSHRYRHRSHHPLGVRGRCAPGSRDRARWGYLWASVLERGSLQGGQRRDEWRSAVRSDVSVLRRRPEWYLLTDDLLLLGVVIASEAKQSRHEPGAQRHFRLLGSVRFPLDCHVACGSSQRLSLSKCYSTPPRSLSMQRYKILHANRPNHV